MEVLNGTTIFWLIAIGMIAGVLVKVCIWKKGVELIPNLIAGVLGAVIVGALGLAIELNGSLMLAFLGSLAILFILNVFHLQPEGNH